MKKGGELCVYLASHICQISFRRVSTFKCDTHLYRKLLYRERGVWKKPGKQRPAGKYTKEEGTKTAPWKHFFPFGQLERSCLQLLGLSTNLLVWRVPGGWQGSCASRRRLLQGVSSKGRMKIALPKSFLVGPLNFRPRKKLHRKGEKEPSWGQRGVLG